MQNITIKELIEKAHGNSCSKGFYDCPTCNGMGEIPVRDGEDRDTCPECRMTGKASKNIGELLMLVVSELGEALEAHRNNRFCKKENIIFYDENIETMIKNNSEIAYFNNFIKNTFEDELADTVIRLCDMCGYFGIKIDDSDFSGSLMCAENIGECLFDFVRMISGLEHVIRYESKEIQAIAFLDLIRQIEYFCKLNNIDLEKHISLKMKYNETREYKHGKKY